MDAKLFVDGEEIALNEFVKKILSGMISGATASLRDVDKGWGEIRVEVRRT